MKIPVFLLEEKQYKPLVKINIDKNSTIEYIKETVNNYFENKYQILDFFINSNESLSFFQNEKYDKFDLSSVWERVESPFIVLIFKCEENSDSECTKLKIDEPPFAKKNFICKETLQSLDHQLLKRIAAENGLDSGGTYKILIDRLMRYINLHGRFLKDLPNPKKSETVKKADNTIITVSKKKNCGKIRIAQQARGESYPNYENYENIPAWSRGKGEWKQLSPFYLKFSDGEIFENAWQAYKVWEKVDKQNTKNWKWPEEKHVNEDGLPNEKWNKWHESLLKHDLPVRRPNGKAIPLYAFWDNRKLDVVEARKEIYIPYLKQLYRANPVYLKLLEKVKSGKNIMIIEPDGPFLEAYPNGLEVDLEILNNLIEKTNYKEEGYPKKYRPYGHGYVLAMTLLEDCKKL